MYEEDSDESWGGESGDDDDDYNPGTLAPPREDLEQIMDEFLSRYEVLGGKMKPVLDSAPGIEGNTGKLERIRRELDNIKLDKPTEGEDPAVTAKRREKERILAAVERQWREESGNKGKIKMSYEKPKERWDCETVLSA
jgi:protein LTV1